MVEVTDDEVREIARAKGADMAQLEAVLAMPVSKKLYRAFQLKEAFSLRSSRLFSPPAPGDMNFWIDTKGSVWAVPYAHHQRFADWLGVSDTAYLEWAGWIHASNAPASGIRTPLARHYGKPNRDQERAIETALGGQIHLSQLCNEYRNLVGHHDAERIKLVELTRRRLDREIAKAAREKTDA